MAGLEMYLPLKGNIKLDVTEWRITAQIDSWNESNYSRVFDQKFFKAKSIEANNCLAVALGHR